MKYIVIILSLFMLSLQNIAAQQSVKETFDAKLVEYSKKNKTIQCDFKQVKKMPKMIKEVPMKGRFFYDNKGAMALLYSQPTGNKILINNDHFTIVMAGKTTTTDGAANPMLRQLGQMMRACMTGDISALGRGWTTTYKEQPDNYLIEMLPTDRRAKKYIHKITLTFDKTDLSLNKLWMQEATGGSSLYEFFNKIFNKEIDNANFFVN